MVDVHLHGPLAKEFGKVWSLDISSPSEAVHAIAVTRPEIKRRVIDLHRKGLVFRVRSKTHDYDNDDVGMSLGNVTRIDIIPIIRGAGPGIRAVIGTLLVVVGYVLVETPIGVPLIAVGSSLIMGAITEWLTPTPKKTSVTNMTSWTMGGPANTVDQGLPVPIIYGEVLTGGYPISGGIVASDTAPNGSVDPYATIGGDDQPVFYTGGAGSFTSRVRYSVGVINMNAPFSYQWTASGFGGAVAIRLVNANGATVTLEVDYTVDNNEQVSIGGTVAVSLSGKSMSGSGDTVNAATTTNVVIHINSAVYVQPGGGD